VLLPPEAQELWSLLLFIPGIIVADYVSRLRHLDLGILDKIIAGSIVWNLTFVSVASLVGFMPDAFGTVAYSFAYLGSAIVGLYLLTDTKRIVHRLLTLEPHVDSTSGLFMLYLAPIVIVVCVIGFYTTPDWDTWAVWLPIAKSITSTGNILYNSLFLSSAISATSPPYLPLVYAWAFVCAGGYYRLIPIVYLLLFGGASYKLSYSLFESREKAWAAVAITLTSLATLATFFGFTLNPDLPAAFFLCSAVAYLVPILKGHPSSANALLLSASLSLLLFTALEGVLYAYVVIALALLALPIPLKKLGFAVLIATPFVLIATQIIGPSLTLTSIPLLLVYVLVVVAIVIRSATPSGLGLKTILKASVPLLPVMIYFWQMGSRTGLWLYGIFAGATYLQASRELLSIMPTISSASQQTLSLLRLDNIFLRFGFLPVSILLIMGLVAESRQRSIHRTVLYVFLIVFLLIALLYPEEYYGSLSLDDSAVRRYLFVIPFVASFSAVGLGWLLRALAGPRKWMASSHGYLVSLVSFNTLMLVYLLVRSQGSWPYPLNGISALQDLDIFVVSASPTLEDVAFLGAALLVSLAFGFLLSYLRKSSQNHFRLRHFVSIMIVLIVISSSISVAYMLRQPTWDAVTQNSSYRNSLPSQIAGDQALVTYFNSAVGNGSIIGFQIYFLATFDNRQVIDMSTVDGLMVFGALFNATNIGSLVSELSLRNVRFIIEPPQGSSGLSVFNEYRARFPMFNAILGSTYVRPVAVLSGCTVYEFA